MINGKPSTLSGHDLANMLRGMSSENIQKVELITNPSAKWDASGNAGIINIIMKKNRMQGYNGNISLGYGLGRFPKYNGALNISYKKNWFNLFMNYSYSNRKSFNHLVINRNFYEDGQLKTVFNNDNYIIYPFSTHTPRLGMDFLISEKTTLSLLGSHYLNIFNPQANNGSIVSDGNNEVVGTYEFINRSKDRSYNSEINTQLNHKFDTTGQEITIHLDYGNYKNNSHQNFSTTFIDIFTGISTSTLLISQQTGELKLYSAKADYTKSISSGLNLETGIKSSLVESDKDMQFFDRTDGIDEFNLSRSSHFLYSENINAAYISLNKKFTKLTIQTGLRAEQTIAKGEQLLNNQGFERDYIQLFPTAYIDYKLHKNHNINLNVGRRIERPRYGQLDPYRRLIDANTYAEGNPFLLPQINYLGELNYSFKNAFNAVLNYTYSTDNLLQILIQDAATQTTIQTDVNLAEFHNYSLELSYSNRLTPWWRTNTSILTYYGKFSGIVRDFMIDTGDPSFYVSTNNSFTIKDGFSMEANLNYNHKNYYGVTEMKSRTNFSVGFQKSVLKKQGTITANLSDVFWTAYPSGITRFGGVVENWTSQRETRVFNLSFSYKFGSGQTGRMRRNTGADEEKKRM